MTNRKRGIATKTLCLLYYQLLRIRLVEERIAAEYSKQNIRCPVHLCIGHEAIPTGVCIQLAKTDSVVSNHRSHGHYLAKGGDLDAMIAELYGKTTGCSHGRGGSQHLIDTSVNFFGSTPIVGGSIPVGVGIAWAARLTKRKQVTVVFFGDAAVEEGVFHESLNFASLHRLPVLFVCENNFYSIVTPLTARQPNRAIYKLARAHGLSAWKAQGNNVLTVYAAAQKALAAIRTDNGPALLEFATYRYKEHCGPLDDPEGFRPAKELKKWKRKCPVSHFERYLLKNSATNQEQLHSIRNNIQLEIERAFKKAQHDPFPRYTRQSLQTVYAP